MESYGVPIFIRYYYDFFDHILSLFVNNKISIFEESFLRQPADTITITTCRPIRIMEITERVKLSTFLKIGCYIFRDMQMTLPPILCSRLEPRSLRIGWLLLPTV